MLKKKSSSDLFAVTVTVDGKKRLQVSISRSRMQLLQAEIVVRSFDWPA